MYTAGTEDDDYDDDDEKDLKLMPPPSFVPKGIKSGDGKSEKSSPQSSPDKSKANTPLAAMLPQELSNIDVAALFPEFRHGQVSKEITLILSLVIYTDRWLFSIQVKILPFSVNFII